LDLAVGLAPSFLTTGGECMDRDVGNLESHLYLLDLVGGPTDVVVLVERVDDHQFGSEILNRKESTNI